MRLKVLGESEQNARTRIVVLCDKSQVKKLKRFFRQPQIVAQCSPSDPSLDVPRFDVIVSERQVTLLAGPALHGSNTLFVQNFHEKQHAKRKTLCGLLARFGDPLTGPVMTTGGLISLVRGDQIDLCAVTVGHFLRAPEPQQHDNSEDDSDSDTSEYDFEYDMEIEFEHDMFKKSDLFLNKEIIRRLDALPPEHKEEKYDLALGDLLFSSHSESSIMHPNMHLPESDWAAFEISDTNWFPNRVQETYGSSIPCPSESTGKKTVPGLSISRNLATTIPSICLHIPRKVIIVSGNTGVVYGSLQEDCAFMPLGPAGSLQRTFLCTITSRTADGSSAKEVLPVDVDPIPQLQPGDCGSWVLDAETLQVHGHIVASDDFGDCYVVPIVDVFEDIKRVSGADKVELASEESFNRSMLNLQHTSPRVAALKTVMTPSKSRPRLSSLQLQPRALRDVSPLSPPGFSPLGDSGYASASSSAFVMSDDESRALEVTKHENVPDFRKKEKKDRKLQLDQDDKELCMRLSKFGLPDDQINMMIYTKKAKLNGAANRETKPQLRQDPLIKVSIEHIAPETLELYQVPYEIDCVSTEALFPISSIRC